MSNVIPIDPWLRRLERFFEDAKDLAAQPPHIVAITVNPQWPRRPIAEVSDGPLLGGIEVFRTRHMPLGKMLLHYSDGSVNIAEDATTAPTKPGGQR